MNPVREPPNFSSLPIELKGRIGDYLTLNEKLLMRRVSRENKAIYSTTPKYEFLFRNRRTMLHLKSGRTDSLMGDEYRLKQWPLSSEIGTTIERYRVLDLFVYKADRWLRNIYLNFFDFLIDPQPPHGGWGIAEWNETRKNSAEMLFYLALGRLSSNEVKFSLFSLSEMQDVTKRIAQEGQFPHVFKKEMDIDLLNYAFVENYNLEYDPPLLTKTPVKTINDLVKFLQQQVGYHHPIFWNWVKEMFVRFLGAPDGSASIDPLREFLTYRFTHELYVDKLSYT